jgi:hypothetical protein
VHRSHPFNAGHLGTRGRANGHLPGSMLLSNQQNGRASTAAPTTAPPANSPRRRCARRLSARSAVSRSAGAPPCEMYAWCVHSGSHHAAEPAREALLLAGPLILISTTAIQLCWSASLRRAGTAAQNRLWRSTVYELRVACNIHTDARASTSLPVKYALNAYV